MTVRHDTGSGSVQLAAGIWQPARAAIPGADIGAIAANRNMPLFHPRGPGPAHQQPALASAGCITTLVMGIVAIARIVVTVFPSL